MKKLLILDDDKSSIENFCDKLDTWPDANANYKVIQNELFQSDYKTVEDFKKYIIPSFLSLVDNNISDTEVLLLDLVFKIAGKETTLGFEIGKLVREKYFKLPIILFTILGPEKIIGHSLVFDFDGYINKSQWASYDSRRFLGDVMLSIRKREAMIENLHNNEDILLVDNNRYFKEIKPSSKDQIFVMMPFDQKIVSSDVFTIGITEAVNKVNTEKSYNFTLFRVDASKLSISVMNQIYTSIKNSKLAICVTTGLNPNVFYELGIAHLFNKEVILLTSNIKDIPFDIRHIRCIKYEEGKINELQEELVKAILEYVS